MDGLEDNSRTLTEFDSDIQRALSLFIPGFITFRRQVQIEGSLIFYVLSQEPLGELGHIELVKRDDSRIDISMQNAPTPPEADVLGFLAVWKKEEHAEALAILTERARARHSHTEARYEHIPAISHLSPHEFIDHFGEAVQIVERAKTELAKQRQIQLWAVVSVVLHRLNTDKPWEIEQDSLPFNADCSTFRSTLEQAVKAVAEQGEPLEIARIEPVGTDVPATAVLFCPEMRTRGVGAIVSAKPLDDGTTSAVVRASEEIWRGLQPAWAKLRVELQRLEPVKPSELPDTPAPVVAEEPNPPVPQQTERLGSETAQVSPKGESANPLAENIPAPAPPPPNPAEEVTAAKAPVRRRRRRTRKPRAKPIYVPKNPIKFDRWKDAWKVIGKTRKEHASGWDESTMERPDPSYREFIDAIKDDLHWSPSEKTIQRILRAGEAGKFK